MIMMHGEKTVLAAHNVTIISGHGSCQYASMFVRNQDVQVHKSDTCTRYILIINFGKQKLMIGNLKGMQVLINLNPA